MSGVHIDPAATALTRMPSSASGLASERVNPTMAAFAVNDYAFVPANERQRGFSQIKHRENIGPEGALRLFGADFLDAIRSVCSAALFTRM